MSSINDQVVSLIRTGVAIAVGTALSWAVRHGLNLGNDSAAATAYITPLAIAAYYTVVRLLEGKFPTLGWLLGIAKAPTYASVSVPAPVPDPVAPVAVSEVSPVRGADGRFLPKS